MSIKTTKSQPDVLTVEEVRKRLRLGRNAMYDAISNGQVPSIRLGRRILIPRLALETLLRGEGNGTSTRKAA
jgi:excisionase family DNA binding protein